MASENDDFRAFCENRDFAPTDIMQTLTDDRGRLTKPQDTPRECAPSTRQAPRSAPITCCYSSKSAVFSVFSASAEDKCHCKTVAAGFDTGCSDIPIHPVNYPKEISAIGELDISRISRLGCLAALWDAQLDRTFFRDQTLPCRQPSPLASVLRASGRVLLVPLLLGKHAMRSAPRD